MSLARRRRCIDHTVRKFGVSERSVCRILGQHRSTQRKVPKGRADDAALTADIIEFATRYGRDGYPPGLKRLLAIADRRRIAALLRGAGWLVNVKRVERIRRLEGLKVSVGQPKRSRFWLNDVSCVRLRPEHPNPVWSYDFVEGRTHDADSDEVARSYRHDVARHSGMMSPTLEGRAGVDFDVSPRGGDGQS